MFKKLLIISLISAFSFGCGILGTSTAKEGDKAPEAVETKNEIADGDLVVAKWTSTSFYEGNASELRPDKIKITWSDGSKAKDVDRSDVYQIPKQGAKPEVQVGEMVLAKISTNSYWNGAEVKEINGDVYVVQAIGRNGTSNVDSHKIIKVSPAVAADFKKRAGSNDFIKTAQSKSPETPKDFKPKKGDKVLALWALNSWYTGTIDKVSGDKVTVAWDDATKPKEVDKDKVLPLPNAENVGVPAVDQYVLTKPQGGSRWYYGQVTEVSGDSITVKNARGLTRTVKKGEAVPLS